MKNLRKILSLILVLAVMACGLTLITASAEEAAPEIQQNLWYGDTIQLMYRVPAGSDTLKYRVKGESEWIDAAYSGELSDASYDVYLTDGVPAQYIDTVLEVKFAGVSEVAKTYSVLEYLYERLYVDGIGEATEGENFDKKNMYESLITYAGFAQKALLEADTYTAIGDYGYVTVEGGNGTGIYAGEVTLTPSIVAGEGQKIVAKVNGTTFDLTDGGYTFSVMKGSYNAVVFEAVDDDIQAAVIIDRIISTTNAGTTYYFNGTISGSALATTTDVTAAAIVSIEETVDGYYIYLKNGGDDKYLQIGTSSTSAALVTKDTASIFTYNEEYESYLTICSDGKTRGFSFYANGKTLRTYVASSNYTMVAFESANEECLANGHDFVWGDVTGATCKVDGTRTGECSRCDATATEVVEGSKDSVAHTPAEEWSSSAEAHWKVCTTCTQTLEYAEHDVTDADCKVCGRPQTEQGGSEPETPAEPQVVATFEFGANGSAAHKDGSTSPTTYTEKSGDYTLSITNASKIYTGSFDAKGNSCLKFGTSSVVGTITFKVADDITEVKIYVAKYKSNTTKVSVNGGDAQTLTKNSNDGAYDVITIDTTENKTITFATVSGGVRAMVNTIEFYK